MQSKKNGEAAPSGRDVAVRIERVKAGPPVFARILSPTIYGCLTHWHKGRSWLCFQKDCIYPFHKLGSQWKGFCAAEFWVEQSRLWKPSCLEITENLELDMRGIFSRGQVWELQVDASSDAKNPPVCGALVETLDHSRLRPPFDVASILRHVYHCAELPPSVRSPLPDRIVLDDVQGEAPLPFREREKAAQARERAERIATQTALCKRWAQLSEEQRATSTVAEIVRLRKVIEQIAAESPEILAAALGSV